MLKFVNQQMFWSINLEIQIDIIIKYILKMLQYSIGEREACWAIQFPFTRTSRCFY